MSDKLLILGSCEGVNPRKDKSWTLRFITQEPTPTQERAILDAYGGFGVIVFHSGKESISDEELKEIDELDVDIYDKPKTQSKRLRSVLYLLWKQEGDDMIEFKDYYKMKTEKIIEHFKSKLEP